MRFLMTDPKKALVVYGGWDGHTPRESTRIFSGWLAGRGFDVTESESLDIYLDEKTMAEADLIVQCVTMSEITQEQCRGLCDAVRNGSGFAGWHGGMIDSFRTDTDYQWMTGGQWVSHPGGCIPSYSVEIADPEHPITQGLGSFTMTDTEQYYLHIDPGIHHLLQQTHTVGMPDAMCLPDEPDVVALLLADATVEGRVARARQPVYIGNASILEVRNVPAIEHHKGV